MIAAGPGERMPAERPSGRSHLVVERRPPQRRHRVLPLARSLEPVAARIDLPVDVASLSRDADLVLDLLVVRLELVVAEGPILDGRSLRNPRRAIAPPRLADHLEVPRVQAPVLRPVVKTGATDAVHHWLAAARRRRRRRRADSRCFAVGLVHRHRPIAEVVAELVGGEVATREPGSRLEPDDLDPRLRQRQHGDASRHPEADHDDIGVFQPSRHDADLQARRTRWPC